jgi:nitrate/TMAO reductase-like tetraheme cytochrome c subunit
MHSTQLVSGDKTCIDCHKGIAHRMPDTGKPSGNFGESGKMTKQATAP